MTERIKVSVLLTSYNHAKYLREAIDSVLNQTFSNFELIIWDDASTDESWQIITSYSDPRIRSFRNEVQKRGIWGINKGISEIALGEYIAIHHSDDVWEPQKLEKQITFLDKNPHIGAVFSRILIINEDGNLFEEKAHYYFSVFDQANRSRHEWLNYFFYHGNALCHPSVLIRKTCFADCGLYRNGFAQIPDNDMWVRLCMKYDIHILPDKLVRFRVRTNEMNTSGNRPETRIRWYFEFLQLLANYRNLSSFDELNKVFPEAEKYLKPQGSDFSFALGMVALESRSNQITELFGLSILFEALSDPGMAKRIKELYGFGHEDFIALTAEHDFFSIELIATLSAQVTEKEHLAQSLKEQLRNETLSLKAQLHNETLTVQSLNGTLQEIYASRGWKSLQKILAIRLAIIPRNSLRESLLRFLLKPRWVSPGALVRRMLAGVRAWFLQRPGLRNIMRPLIPASARARLNRVAQGTEIVTAGPVVASKMPTDWDDYVQLSQNIKTAGKTRLAALAPKQPSMINLDRRNLLEIARSLKFKKQDAPEVSIIIPVHNHGRLTLECLVSINQQTDSIPYQIVVVDDGSDQELITLLQAVPNILLVRNPERIGFTQSCNKGADAASGKYLAFLNNDTQVVRGWLEHLLNTFEGHLDVGAAGPKVIYPDGRLQEAGALVNQDGTTTLIGLTDDPDLPCYNYDREIDYCSGVCLFVEANTFRSIGGFDEVYAPAYYEDVDLCLKLRTRGLKIFYCSRATIIHHLSATSQEIDSSFKLGLVARNRQLLLERWQSNIDELNLVKLIAFYLPQYHPIPENDLWWGKGFTEWANVTRAKPSYEGHYQPHLPADLGFYDLRISTVMEQQVELAKQYGIYGFCYYYYWFGGERILEMPLERMLETGKPDFPFCLCWANENWSRRWDGSEDHVLLAQNHSDSDDLAVIGDIARFMRHPNYIRVNGKPILLLYRSSLFPNIKRTTEIWRRSCADIGIGEIHLVMVKSFEFAGQTVDPTQYGFDASVDFPPHNFLHSTFTPTNILNRDFRGIVGDYSKSILNSLSSNKFELARNYLTVFPRWDNTARQPNTPFIFEGTSPGAFQAWLEKCIEITRCFHSGDEKLIFINAWNEWAEGNHLEPDQQFGHRHLEAIRNAMEKWQLK